MAKGLAQPLSAAFGFSGFYTANGMNADGGRWRDIVRHRPFGLVLLAIVASRLWFALTFPVVQISDYEAYYDEARGFASLSARGVTPFNSIGPKLFFSVWFRLFGDGLRGVGVANTFLYAAAVGLAYAGTMRAFGRTTAVVLSLVAFISLSELYFINLACSEILGAFFVSWIYFLISAGSLSWRKVALVGFASGLAVYNRSNILPTGLLVLVHELLMTRAVRPALMKAVAVQSITLGVTLPLCVFNLAHFGRFTPLIANAEALWYGNNPKLSGDFHSYTKVPEDFPPGTPEREQLRREFSGFYLSPDRDLDFSSMNPYEVGDVKVRYALSWIGSEPGRYAHLIWARFQFLFFSCTYGEVPFRYYDADNPAQPRWSPGHQRLIERARLPIRNLYQFLIAGALVGLLITTFRDRTAFLLATTKGSALVIVAFYSAPFLLTAAANRYHIPILTLAWVYLAHGTVLVGRGIRTRFRPT